MTFWQAELWNPMLRGKSGSGMGEGSVDDPRESFVLVSFFDRLKPVDNESTDNPNRADLLRRGARHLDRSAALAAGGLVIIARSHGNVPMPVPLEVEGDKITGDGPVYYQFVLPLNQSALPASTQPSETARNKRALEPSPGTPGCIDRRQR